jgi:hypothetical protein
VNRDPENSRMPPAGRSKIMAERTIPVTNPAAPRWPPVPTRDAPKEGSESTFTARDVDEQRSGKVTDKDGR